MTSPDRFTTDKTYSPSTVHSMQQETKEAAALRAHTDTKSLMDAAGGSFVSVILGGFANIAEAIGDALENLSRAIFGDYDGSYGPLLDIQDGQNALKERIELLGNSGFCSTTMSHNYKLGKARNRALPFNTLIAPPQDATLMTVNRAHPAAGSTVRQEWVIRLDRAGLWQANAHFSHGGDDMGDSYAEIVVLRPDLTVYSSTLLPQAAAQSNLFAPRGGAPVSLFKMFVTDTPGYYVQVRWRWDAFLGARTVRGGAISSQFSVTQWSEKIAGDVNDDPEGTIDDDSGEDPEAPAL